MTDWFTNVAKPISTFYHIPNTGIAVGLIILAIIALLLILKNAPRWIHLVLWGLVAACLFLPFSTAPTLSLIPGPETAPQEPPTPNSVTDTDDTNNTVTAPHTRHTPRHGSSDHAVKLMFSANEVLTDVCFTSLQYENDTYTVSEQLDFVSQLHPEILFVAEAVLYGDTTTYGLSFTDSNGDPHNYSVYISGRNGALVFEEYPH